MFTFPFGTVACTVIKHNFTEFSVLARLHGSVI